MKISMDMLKPGGHTLVTHSDFFFGEYNEAEWCLQSRAEMAREWRANDNWCTAAHQATKGTWKFVRTCQYMGQTL